MNPPTAPPLPALPPSPEQPSPASPPSATPTPPIPVYTLKTTFTCSEPLSAFTTVRLNAICSSLDSALATAPSSCHAVATAGSTIVTVTQTVDTSAAQESALAALQTSLASTDLASSLLGLAVIDTPSVVTSFDAPATPPPAPLPPPTRLANAPPLPLSPSSQGISILGLRGTTLLAVGAGAAAVLLLLLAALLLYCRRGRDTYTSSVSSPAAQARGKLSNGGAFGGKPFTNLDVREGTSPSRFRSAIVPSPRIDPLGTHGPFDGPPGSRPYPHGQFTPFGESPALSSAGSSSGRSKKDLARGKDRAGLLGDQQPSQLHMSTTV